MSIFRTMHFDLTSAEWDPELYADDDAMKLEFLRQISDDISSFDDDELLRLYRHHVTITDAPA